MPQDLGRPRARAIPNGVWSLGAQGTTSVAKFGVFVIAANVLGPEGQGYFAVSVAVGSGFALMASMGVDTANTVFIGRDPGRLGELLGSSFLFSLVAAGVACLGAALALGIGIVPANGGAALPVAAAVAAISSLHLLQLVLVGCLAGMRDFAGIFIGTLCRFPLVLAVVLMVGSRLTPLTALLAWAGGALVADIVLAARLRRHGAGFGVARPDIVREQLAFGIRSHLDRVANILTYRLDLFLVGVLAGPSAAGLYSVAQQLAEALLLVPRGIGQVLLAAEAGRRASHARWTYYAGTMALVGSGAALLAITADWIVPTVFSTTFVESVQPLRLLLIGVTVMSVGILHSARLIGGGRPELSALAGGVALVVTLVLDLVLIPDLGILGAAIASVAAYSSYSLATVVGLRILGNPEPSGARQP